MTADDLRAWRADVIERSINLETIISAIICQHYFKRVSMPFLLEVLYDEYFSFGLKRRLLEKITRHSELSTRMNELNRLNTIRNYFAHCGLEIHPVGTETSFVPDPRKPEGAIDFSALYAEFQRLAPGVEAFLAEVLKSKGGELLTKPPTAT